MKWSPFPQVEEGQLLVLLSAMKLETEVRPGRMDLFFQDKTFQDSFSSNFQLFFSFNGCLKTHGSEKKLSLLASMGRLYIYLHEWFIFMVYLPT